MYNSAFRIYDGIGNRNILRLIEKLLSIKGILKLALVYVTLDLWKFRLLWMKERIILFPQTYFIFQDNLMICICYCMLIYIMAVNNQYFVY